MDENERVIDDHMAALIKGMIARGDRQSDIAACFLTNGGRVSEINTGNASTGKRFAHVRPAPSDQLPPCGPYPSPYELLSAISAVWQARVALEHTKEKIEAAIQAIRNAEQKMHKGNGK